MVNEWEKSGSGGGNRDPSADDFGHVYGEELVDGDDRKSFLKGNQPYVLYYWYLMDKYELLAVSLSIIPTKFKMISSYGPAISTQKKAHVDEQLEVKRLKNQEKVANSLEQLGKASFEMTSLMAKSAKEKSKERKFERREKRLERRNKSFEMIDSAMEKAKFGQQQYEDEPEGTRNKAVYKKYMKLAQSNLEKLMSMAEEELISSADEELGNDEE